jgi:hypothetical protein
MKGRTEEAVLNLVDTVLDDRSIWTCCKKKSRREKEGAEETT